MSETTLLIIERLGFPVALLVALVLAMWRGARWLAPRIDKLIERHMQFIDKLENELSAQTVTLREIKAEQVLARGTESTTRIAILESIEKVHESTRDCMHEIREAILRLGH